LSELVDPLFADRFFIGDAPLEDRKVVLVFDVIKAP
jgi:hypothetical protein